MRTFLAFEIPGPIREALAHEIDRLDRSLPAETIRWVRPASIHLTLKFLGEVDRPTADRVEAAVRPLAAATPRTEALIGGFGVFPHRSRPRVLWVGIEPRGGAVLELWHQLEATLDPLGFERDRRAFTPHLTLGRVQRGLAGRARQQLVESLASVQIGPLGEMEMRELTLFHSDLRPGGAVYTPLATFPLREV